MTDKRTRTLQTKSEPGHFPMIARVVDVVDRLETGELSDIREPMIQATTRTCASLGLEHSEVAIANAVSQHLAEHQDSEENSVTKSTILPNNRGVALLFGWNRPKSMAEREKRLGKNGRWLNLLRRLAKPRAFRLNGLAAGVGSVTITAPFFSWSVVYMSGCFGLLVGTLFIDLLARKYVEQRTLGLNEWHPSSDEIKAWLANPQCEQAVRQCLISDVPLLLDGDVRLLNLQLEATRVKEQSMSAEFKRADREIENQSRRDALRSLFLSGSNPDEGTADIEPLEKHLTRHPVPTPHRSGRKMGPR